MREGLLTHTSSALLSPWSATDQPFRPEALRGELSSLFSAATTRGLGVVPNVLLVGGRGQHSASAGLRCLVRTGMLKYFGRVARDSSMALWSPRSAAKCFRIVVGRRLSVARRRRSIQPVQAAAAGQRVHAQGNRRCGARSCGELLLRAGSTARAFPHVTLLAQGDGPP